MSQGLARTGRAAQPQPQDEAAADDAVAAPAVGLQPVPPPPLQRAAAALAGPRLHGGPLHGDRDRPGAAGGAKGDPQVVLEGLRREAAPARASRTCRSPTPPTRSRPPPTPRTSASALVRATKKKGPKEYVIRGVLGRGDPGRPGARRPRPSPSPSWWATGASATLLITRILDDFSALSQEALRQPPARHPRRVRARASCSRSTCPGPSAGRSRTSREAARQVAAGDLSVQVPPRGRDEIGSLSRTFNEMVERLRENRALEERLHFAERSTRAWAASPRRWPTRSAIR